MVSATRRIVIEVMGKDSTKGFRSLKQSLGEIKNLIGSLEQAMQPNIQFEAEMSRVKAITGAVGKEFKDLERLAKTLGSTTFFSGTQAAEGIRFLAMAGLETDDIFKVLPSTLNLARVGMIDLGRAADIATNILSGMSLPAEEAQRVIDVMAKAVTSANLNIEELGRGMRVAAPLGAGLRRAAGGACYPAPGIGERWNQRCGRWHEAQDVDAIHGGSD